MVNLDKLKRILRARELLERDQIAIIQDKDILNRFYVKSYIVQQNSNGTWTCSCPDFIFRRQICKHIYAVIMKFKKT